MLRGGSGILLLLGVSLAGFLALELRTYERLTHEQHAAELQFLQQGERNYVASLRLPSGESRRLVLQGDEWQIDARMLKWRGIANLRGFDTVYRLERIGGRYRDVERERKEPRTVYALADPARFDLWDWARRSRHWLPAVDALYGSAAYLPMADGASFEVSVSQSGVVARPGFTSTILLSQRSR